MNRILIVDRGVVLPGKEELFHKLIVKESKDLRRIYQEMKENDPGLFEDLEKLDQRTDADWEKEAKHSLIAASYRLGNGTISVSAETLSDDQK